MTYQELNNRPPLAIHLLVYQVGVYQQEVWARAAQHFYQSLLSPHYSSTCASDEDEDVDGGGGGDAHGDDDASSS